LEWNGSVFAKTYEALRDMRRGCCELTTTHAILGSKLFEFQTVAN